MCQSFCISHVRCLQSSHLAGAQHCRSSPLLSAAFCLQGADGPMETSLPDTPRQGKASKGKPPKGGHGRLARTSSSSECAPSTSAAAPAPASFLYSPRVSIACVLGMRLGQMGLAICLVERVLCVLYCSRSYSAAMLPIVAAWLSCLDLMCMTDRTMLLGSCAGLAGCRSAAQGDSLRPQHLFSRPVLHACAQGCAS